MRAEQDNSSLKSTLQDHLTFLNDLPLSIEKVHKTLQKLQKQRHFISEIENIGERVTTIIEADEQSIHKNLKDVLTLMMQEKESSRRYEIVQQVFDHSLTEKEQIITSLTA